jgi:hypothetical protein
VKERERESVCVCVCVCLEPHLQDKTNFEEVVDRNGRKGPPCCVGRSLLLLNSVVQHLTDCSEAGRVAASPRLICPPKALPQAVLLQRAAQLQVPPTQGCDLAPANGAHDTTILSPVLSCVPSRCRDTTCAMANNLPRTRPAVGPWSALPFNLRWILRTDVKRCRAKAIPRARNPAPSVFSRSL